jgi:hypothetical protein
MRGRAFNLAAVVSLGLALLVAAAWPASRIRPVAIEFDHGKERWDFRSEDGGLAVTNRPQFVKEWRAYQAALDRFFQRRVELLGKRQETLARLIDAPVGSAEWESLQEARRTSFEEYNNLTAPARKLPLRKVYSVRYATLLCGMLYLPGYWVAARAFRASKARRQARIGMCRSCGYDLRATPQRCPECGAAGTAVRG